MAVDTSPAFQRATNKLNWAAQNNYWVTGEELRRAGFSIHEHDLNRLWGSNGRGGWILLNGATDESRQLIESMVKQSKLTGRLVPRRLLVPAGEMLRAEIATGPITEELHYRWYGDRWNIMHYTAPLALPTKQPTTQHPTLEEGTMQNLTGFNLITYTQPTLGGHRGIIAMRSTDRTSGTEVVRVLWEASEPAETEEDALLEAQAHLEDTLSKSLLSLR